MKAHNFEFAGKKLNDFGFIVCHFDAGGLDTVSNGAVVTFNTIPTLNGAHHKLISTTYDECLQTTIQICKNPCNSDTMEISPVAFRSLTAWLCRKQFLKFKLLTEEYIDLYYEVIINVSKIELDGKIVGLELEITCNRPFALKEPRIITINNTIQDGKHSINDISHEEGYIYPWMEITVNADGDLRIYNAIEKRETKIANCKTNEVITLDYPVIKSSLPSSSHNIQNDFNWTFFRVANTYGNSRNDLIISLPCSIKIKYSPIVKVGL